MYCSAFWGILLKKIFELTNSLLADIVGNNLENWRSYWSLIDDVYTTEALSCPICKSPRNNSILASSQGGKSPLSAGSSSSYKYLAWCMSPVKLGLLLQNKICSKRWKDQEMEFFTLLHLTYKSAIVFIPMSSISSTKTPRATNLFVLFSLCVCMK